TGDRWGVSGPVAAVDVVAAQDDPAELLGGEVDLVGRLAAAEDAERLRPVGRAGGAEAGHGPLEGLVPGRGSQRAGPAVALADQRGGQAGVMLRHGRLLARSVAARVYAGADWVDGCPGIRPHRAGPAAASP